MFSDSEEEFSAPEEITFEKSRELAQKLPRANLKLKPTKKRTEVSEKIEDFIPLVPVEEPVKPRTNIQETLSATTLSMAELESLRKLKALMTPSTSIPRRNCALQYKTTKIVKAKK